MLKRPFPTLLLLPLLLFLTRGLGQADTAVFTEQQLPPDWFYESSQSAADLGYAVDSGGDVNGDGYADVLVGAVKYTVTTYKGGAVFGFFGSPSGLDATPDWIFGGDQSGAELGTAVAFAGDVNGDMIDDIIVSAAKYNHDQPREGQVYVFYGSVSGLSSTPDWTFESDQTDAYLGVSVDTAGDINGDGFDDVIMGAKWYANGESNEGAVFLFYGSASGLSETPDRIIEGNQVGASLGSAVAGAGDVNGDGFDDVLIGAPLHDDLGEDEGIVYLYLGSGAGLCDAPIWSVKGSQTDMRMGQAVSAAGDVNGDGKADILIGAPGFDIDANPDVGAAFVFAGTATGAADEWLWTAVSNQPYALFGSAVNSAGDINQDGFADIAVGAPQYSQDQSEEGVIYIYLGGPTGLEARPHWRAEGNKSETDFGAAIGSGGDVNLDGYDDLVVGAPEFRNQTDLRGRAFLFTGRDADALSFSVFLPLIYQ